VLEKRRLEEYIAPLPNLLSQVGLLIPQKGVDTMRTTRRGFTLVELLVVFAVIGALMGVATPASINAVKQAKASQVAQNFRNLRAAVVTYVQKWWY